MRARDRHNVEDAVTSETLSEFIERPTIMLGCISDDALFTCLLFVLLRIHFLPFRYLFLPRDAYA